MCSSETASVVRIWNFEFRRILFEQKEEVCKQIRLPDDAIKSLARCFYPSMVKFFNSEEGQREYEEWLKEQEALNAAPIAA